MPAYLLADVAPHDMAAYRASGYLEAVVRIAAEFGGRCHLRFDSSQGFFFHSASHWDGLRGLDGYRRGGHGHCRNRPDG